MSSTLNCNLENSTQQFSLGFYFKPVRINQFYKPIINIYSIFVNVFIIILEYIIILLRNISQSPKEGSTINRNEYESLTTQKDNDIEELMLHHFGKLHEHNYIASIVHKHEWDRLRRDIEEFLNEQIRRESFLKEEMSNLKIKMELLLNSIDQFKTTIVKIPAPPPLPSLGFILPQDSEKKVGEESQIEKRTFNMDYPRKPFITVEALKSVKLKKTSRNSKKTMQ